MHSSNSETVVDARGLVPVAVKTLQGRTEISFDLYLWPSKSTPPRLYREKSVPLDPADLQQLLDESIVTLYTRSCEAQQYCDHVRSHVLADETIPAKDRYCATQGCDAERADGVAGERGRRRLVARQRRSRAGHGRPGLRPEECLQRPARGDDAPPQDATRPCSRRRGKGDIDGVLHVSADLGQDMVALVSDRKNVFSDLLAVMTHDYSTFTHLINTCTCCVVLAEAHGIRDRVQLMEIAQGALLHDVGKCYHFHQGVEQDDAAHPGGAGNDPPAPRARFRGLCLRGDLSWGQLMMVYQHHERFDGRGYPVGLVGDEIHEWARLCAVADVHDALTRDRAYHKGTNLRTCWNIWTASRAAVLTRISANVGLPR